MTTQEYLDTRDPELYPCPFCGGEAHLTNVTLDPKLPISIDVSCVDAEDEGCLGAQIKADFKTAQMAIKAWNQRPQLNPL